MTTAAGSAFTATATAPGPVMTSAIEQVGEGMASLAPAVTIHDVELARVGDWDGASGKVALTKERLEAMAAAAADPEMDAPAIHLGHFDARFSATRTGEPALGYVGNVRVAGDRLIGDLQGVPAKLAAMIPHAYRRRSIEAAWNVPGSAGRIHAAALTGLALLGVQAPAVKGLADALSLYSASSATPGAGRAIESIYVSDADTPPSGSPYAAPGAPAGHDGGVTTTPTAPGGTVPTVNEARVRELMAQGGDAAVAALIAEFGAQPTAAAPAVEPAAPAAPAPVTPGSPVVAQTPTAPAPAVGVQPGGQAPAPEPVLESVAASAAPAAPGTVTLSAAQWSRVESALGQLDGSRRQATIDAALSSGRIAPAEVPAWSAQLERDEAGTTALLSALQPTRVPVVALGGAGVVLAAGAAGDAAYDEFERSLGLDLHRPTQTGA